MLRGLNRVVITVSVALILVCAIMLYSNPRIGIELLQSGDIVTDAFADNAGPSGSQATWLDQHARRLKCKIKYASEYPFCGMVMKFVDRNKLASASGVFNYAYLKHQDLNAFQWLEVRYRYLGENSSLTLFSRSASELPQTFEHYLETQYSHVSFGSRTHLAVITLADMYVADWWLAKSQLPQEQKRLDLSHVFEIGIGLPVSPIAGEHEITVESIRALKPLISRWALYIILSISICVLLIASLVMLFMRRSHKVIEENHELKVLAHYDVLTECLNRRGLEQAIELLFVTRQYGTYLFVIDIDHFKQVNDTYGHDVGDRVLREVSMSLQSVLRDGDIFGRWGGEEFLLISSLSADYLPSLIQRMLSAISAISIPQSSHAFRITASIGVTEITNVDNFESAFSRADKAMYSVKSSGRNGWRFS